jgi:hypothetical protein
MGGEDDTSDGILMSLGRAGVAAMIAVTFIHPVDTVKTRMQVSGTQGARNYKSVMMKFQH